MSLWNQRPYLLALLICIVLTLWLFSGHAQDTALHPTPQVNSSTELMTVRTQTYQAQPLTRQLVITGRSAPFRTTTLKAEIAGAVKTVEAQRGQRIAADELIVRLATEERALRLKEAQTLMQQREFEYNAQQNLLQKGYQAQVQLAEAKTLVDSAQTQVKQAEIALARTEIRAPFAGVLLERWVEQGDYVAVGDPIAQIMDEDPFLIRGDIAEQHHHLLHVGHQASIKLIDGQTLTGHVSLIAAQADAATRTFAIEVTVANPQRTLAAGMSCEIQLPLETLLAHRVSPALLSLNDAGVLGIKAVDTNNQVLFYPATLSQATAEGIWLTDLPPVLKLITVGQGFVRPGDRVQVSEVAVELLK